MPFNWSRQVSINFFKIKSSHRNGFKLCLLTKPVVCIRVPALFFETNQNAFSYKNDNIVIFTIYFLLTRGNNSNLLDWSPPFGKFREIKLVNISQEHRTGGTLLRQYEGLLLFRLPKKTMNIRDPS